VRISLSSGRVVRLDGLYVTETYASLWEGVPDDTYNARMIEEARGALVHMWNERRTYVIPPAIRRITHPGRTYDRLPDVRYHAWLSSDAVDRGAGSASELVLVWFQSEDHEATLFDTVARAVRSIDWESLAKDFDY
jgi:hypothetical protein